MQSFSQKHTEIFKNNQKIKDYAGKYEVQLIQKAKFYSHFFRIIPGIQGIYIGNSVAMNAAHKDSDIDLLIITSPTRIWTARIYITFLCAILGIRKTQKKHAGKFCLSFFIDTSAMNFENIAEENDIYLAYWIETLIPLIDRNNTLSHLKSQNQWYQFEGNKKTYKNKNLGEKNIKSQKKYFFGDLQEKLLKKFFLGKTLKSFEKKGFPYGVIIDDSMLKFHDQDQRKIISKQVF